MNKLLLSIALLALSFTTFAIETHVTKCSVLDDNFEKSECSFTISFRNPNSLEEHMVIKESSSALKISSNCSDELFDEDINKRSSISRVLTKREEILDPSDYSNSYEIAGVKVMHDTGDSTLNIDARYEYGQFVPSREEVILGKYSRWRAEGLSEKRKNIIYKKHLYSRKLTGAIFSLNIKGEIRIKHLIKCDSLSSNLTYVRGR